jgi:hypothetical protein
MTRATWLLCTAISQSLSCGPIAGRTSPGPTEKATNAALARRSEVATAGAIPATSTSENSAIRPTEPEEPEVPRIVEVAEYTARQVQAPTVILVNKAYARSTSLRRYSTPVEAILLYLELIDILTDETFIQVHVFDGRTAHAILLVGADAVSNQAYYSDPWNSDPDERTSFLQDAYNLANVAAVPALDGDPPLWRVSTDELRRTLYGAIVLQSELAAANESIQALSDRDRLLETSQDGEFRERAREATKWLRVGTSLLSAGRNDEGMVAFGVAVALQPHFRGLRTCLEMNAADSAQKCSVRFARSVLLPRAAGSEQRARLTRIQSSLAKIMWPYGVDAERSFRKSLRGQ